MQTADKLTRREDFNTRSIQELRNTIEVSGEQTLSARFTNDTVILHTPTDAGDTLTLPTNGRIGTFIVYINVGEVAANVSDGSQSWEMVADQGMLFTLTNATLVPAATSEVLSAILEYYPTKAEIISTGWTEGDGTNGTTTPVAPTIATCESLYRAVVLSWSRQKNLTNFDHYEVQVSDDDSTWYSLEFDGSDWKDALAADTDWDVEFLTHTNIPLTGDVDNPSGKTLHYRVRTVTKAETGNTSDWSASISTTTQTVKAGDLAQDIIYANNIRSGVLQALFAEITSLYVGYDGTGDYSAPDEGDLSWYFDKAEQLIRERTDGSWSDANALRIGGRDSNGVFISGVACKQVVNPLADEISQEFLPSDSFDVVTFDNTTTSLKGIEASTVSPYVDYTTEWSKFGTYALCADSGHYGEVIYYDTSTTAKNPSAGVWFYIEDVPTGSNHPVMRSVIHTSDGYYGVTLGLYYDSGPTWRMYFYEYSDTTGYIQELNSTHNVTPTAGEGYACIMYDADNQQVLCNINGTTTTMSTSSRTLSGDVEAGETILYSDRDWET